MARRKDSFSNAASGPRPCASRRACSLGLSAAVAIALGGCEISEAQQQEMMRREANREWQDAYESCLYDVTGPFAAASFDVMKECERQTNERHGERL